MELQRLGIVVQGKVQGVGFRFFTAHCARGYHITGWVCNRPDNSVEMEVQGSPEQLHVFRTEINQGPLLARVHDLRIVELPIVADEAGFDIRY